MAGTELPLAGRADELAIVERGLAHGRGVALIGHGGVGKTRLAAEALHSAERMRLPTARVVATPSAAAVPFGAVAPVLPPGLSDGSSLLDTLLAAAEALTERAGRARLVLGVDDAHALDEASAALVGHVAATGVVLVVATVRSGEHCPDAVERLWTDGVVDRVELGPLSRSAVDELVEDALGGAVARVTAAEVWRLSQGNPLMAREVVRAGLRAGRLAEADGWWRHEGPLAADEELHALVDARLGALDSADRAVLDVLAIGEPLDSDVLDGLTDSTRVQGLARSGMVTIDHDDRRGPVRLAHPLYGEVLRAHLPRTRKRRLHRQLAEAIEADPARAERQAVRLGMWRLESGGDADPRLLAVAARQAVTGFDHRLGERLARAALRADGFAADTHAAAQLSLAESLVGQQRFDEAETALASADESATTDAQRAQAALTRASCVFVRHGGPAAVDVLERKRVSLADPQWRDELDAAQAVFRTYFADHSGAIAVADRVVAGRSASDRPALVALLAATISRTMVGRAEEALPGLDRGAAIADRMAHPPLLARPRLGLGRVYALAHLGRLEEADGRATAGYDDAVERGLVDLIGAWATSLAIVAYERGHIVRARRVLAEGAAALQRVDPLDFASVAGALQALTAAIAGDVSDARTHLARTAEHHGERRDRLWLYTARARAWTAAATGDTVAAHAHLRHGAAVEREKGQLPFAAGALSDVARLGGAAAVTAELAELAADVDGDYVPAMAAHAAAAAAADPAALASAGEHLAAVGADLSAAEAFARAADLWRSQDDRRGAATARARSRTLVRRCGPVRTPALQATDDGELTAREREVADLVGAGLTSREVATRLSLSTRTIDNHLRRVYRKLGVAGRAHLAELQALEGAGP